MQHYYIKEDINVDDDFIQNCASKYLAMRGRIKADIGALSNEPNFKRTGFRIERIQEIITRHTVPQRPADGSTKLKHLDIYRSDLGELLMTLFFEEKLSQSLQDEIDFTIPIKNIWDRENNDQPGRGVDAVGYRCMNELKPTLFLGESKVSEEKRNPPQVVHTKDDSIYHTHLKHATDKVYLLNKLSNYSKKLEASHAGIVFTIIYGIEEEDNSLYDVIYGCCMVRDVDCILIDDDYGKLKTKQTEFDPNYIYFYIPNFNIPIEQVVELFYDEVQKQSL